MKKILTFTIVTILLFFTSCTPRLISGVKSFEIIKDDVAINELEVSVGDEITLDTQTDTEEKVSIVWESSNNSIISIDAFGRKIGNAILKKLTMHLQRDKLKLLKNMQQQCNLL